MNEYSLMAYNVARIHSNLCYQKILGILSDGHTRTREQISQATGLRLQTVCGRINELVGLDILTVAGEGKTSSGRRAEKIGINPVVM